ncbi:MAG: hypothetical protein ABIB04_01440 [Patescibacteria group bacterium]
MLTGKTPKTRFYSPLKMSGKTALTREQKKLMTKAEKRMLEWSTRETSNIAKSAAHKGIIERPTEKNISKLLEIRRAQSRGHGTSVYRLKKWWEEDEDDEQMKLADKSATNESSDPDAINDEEEKKPKLIRLQPKIITSPTPKKNQYGDLN